MGIFLIENPELAFYLSKMFISFAPAKCLLRNGKFKLFYVYFTCEKISINYNVAV
jgi:hypothetical protein